MKDASKRYPRLTWLIRLRWIAAAVQAGLIAGAATLVDVHIQVIPLVAIVVLMAASNGVLHVWARGRVGVHEALVPGVLALDTMLVTLGLSVSGGPMNPFSFLYVVYVAVAAVMTVGHWRWLLFGMAVGGYGLLYVVDSHDHHGEAMAMHLQGMWVAMAVTAGLIIYFVSMLQRELSRRERELASVRANQQTLASLTAMAAGAAHELATPLSTIAITSKELQRELEQRDGAQLAEDATIIRSQVERCRAVLDRMASDAGQVRGERTRPTGPGSVLKDALDSLSDADRISVDIGGALPDIHIPRESFSEVLTSLLQNAVDASPADRAITASVRPRRGGVVFEIVDDGSGMSVDELARATEPFFTTKDRRNRMGLGLYVARQLAVDLGGELEIDSESGSGTRVRLWIPARQETAS